MKLVAIAASLLFASLTAFAQTAADPPAEPQYVLSAGLGFNHYETPQATGELGFSARIASGTYNISTLKMTSKLSTLTTGIAKRFYAGQGFTMSALIDGGLSAGGGNVGGTVSGGGLLTYDVSRFAKVEGAFVYGAVKVVQSSLGGVQPAFSFGVGKTF